MRLLPLALLLACNPDASPTCEGRLDLDNDGLCDADVVDWSPDAQLGAPRHNLYGYDDELLRQVTRDGIRYAHAWPNPRTALLLPWRPVDNFLNDEANAGFRALAEQALGFGTVEDFFDWFGVARFPAQGAETGIYDLDLPPGASPGDAVGVSVIDTPWGEGLTFSCAACHSSSLFGRTVLGASNRRVRAHATFHLAENLTSGLDADLFASAFGATPAEAEMYERNLQALRHVRTKRPEVLGLDTAVAQVGLALAMRDDDPDASLSVVPTLDPTLAHLETMVADVKPPVWWNLRYKTRWSSDGIHRSGNPMIYSIVANELGRGTDLVELRQWFHDNQALVEAFTAAMFATQAPRWTDFFDASTLDEPAARRGQALYDTHCASCHGTYSKGWDRADAEQLSPNERLANVSLAYHPSTPVYDVGTDPQRREAAAALVERLGRLAIHVDSGTTFEHSAGYVPPPLDGLFARYPYLHNNSVPTLCDLLSPPEARAPSFWQGPAEDPTTDFDADCVGYPTGEAVPEAWKEEEEAFYDTSVPGLSNVGHDTMLRGADGAWVLTPAERDDLVMFLKTL
jgi:mono/diheme cytochrome c family protein